MGPRASTPSAHATPARTILTDIPSLKEPLVLACSQRAGGNCDCAAQALAHGLQEAGTAARLLFLRDMDLTACRGCQACSRSPGHRCVLMEHDQSEELFRLLLGAPMLFLAAPIYFYHLPAFFKGFIDRAQRYYEARTGGDPGFAALPQRSAHACLLAGRPRGDRLFEGSLLTLRYFLWPFNATLGQPLCLPGYDAAADLRRDAQAVARISQFAQAAWKNAGRP